MASNSSVRRFFISLTLILSLSALSGVVRADELKGTIVGISEDFGNLDTSFSQANVDTLGIELGSEYTLLHQDTSVTVTLGSTYSDVAEGEWISFLDDLGKLRIARNFENAAATLDAKVGDAIAIAR
jgi:S-adenosylmethionine hydrolase